MSANLVLYCMIKIKSHTFFKNTVSLYYNVLNNNVLRERSHMTSAAEGGGGFKMLTVADKGGEV